MNKMFQKRTDDESKREEWYLQSMGFVRQLCDFVANKRLFVIKYHRIK